ncbi:MAG: NnrU family protein [Pseudomonadota bacterium]
MILLILGIALWWGAHLFKRLAKGPRAAMQERLGDAARGVFALLIVVSIGMMTLGYQQAAFINVWFPPTWTVHLNNTLMWIAVVLFALSASKGRSRAWFRHPMLLGFTVWSFAHLLVNGDLASILLFGGLGIWAITSIFVINTQDGPWERPEPGPVSGDVRVVLISTVVFLVIAGIHAIFVWPFPGGAA